VTQNWQSPYQLLTTTCLAVGVNVVRRDESRSLDCNVPTPGWRVAVILKCSECA
jgi:hypothetical protein